MPRSKNSSTSAITSSTSTRSSSACSARADAAVVARALSLLHDQGAARGLFVVFVEELVAPRFLRAHLDDGILARGHDLLDVQVVAFQLHRVPVEIPELDHDRGVGRRVELSRIELLVLVAQGDLNVRISRIDSRE